MTEGGGRSCFPKVGTFCCLLPLDVGVKLIAFAELLVCTGLFIYTLVEVTRGPPAKGIGAPPGDVLYLHYTALVDVIFAIYLLVGMYFNKPQHAKFWSIAQLTHLSVSILITLYKYLFMDPIPTKSAFLKQLLEFIFTTGLDAYFILVVYSYYRECRKAERNRPPEATLT